MKLAAAEARAAEAAPWAPGQGWGGRGGGRGGGGRGGRGGEKGFVCCLGINLFGWWVLAVWFGFIVCFFSCCLLFLFWFCEGLWACW